MDKDHVSSVFDGGVQNTGKPSVEIKIAAQRLRHEIDRYGRNATFVGIGLGVIHVYIEVRRKQYLATPVCGMNRCALLNTESYPKTTVAPPPARGSEEG